MKNQEYEISMTPFTLAAKTVVDDYTKVSINMLADGYCEAYDADNDFLKNGYLSAIILRFWSKISKLTMLHPKLFPTYSDAFDAIIYSITESCKSKYRAWQKTNISAEASINQILNSHCIANGYTKLGLKKNGGLKKESEGGGGGIELISLDTVIDEDNDETIGDKIAGEDSVYDNFKAHNVVQSLINNEKFVEAIIIDNVLFRDVFKRNSVKIKKGDKTFETTEISLWGNRLIRELNSLDKDYFDSFMEKYDISKKLFTPAFNDIVKASNPKKHLMIEKCQEFLRCNADVYI